MVTMDLIPNQADGMAKAVGYALHKDFGQGKLIFDCVMICATTAMTLITARRIIGIGVGTVFSALFIGRMIQLYHRLMGGCLNRVLEESRKAHLSGNS